MTACYRCFLICLYITKATTAKISSQVCSGRKPMAFPTAFKRNTALDPTSPGRSLAVFLPRSKGLQPVGDGADDHTDRDACGKKDRGHRHAVYFGDIFNPLPSGMARSLSSIFVLNRASSSSLCATLSSAATLSKGEVYSSSMSAMSSSFWRRSSASCSFSSSRGFVVLSLSSKVFQSCSFAERAPLSLSTCACSFSLFFTCF